MVKIEFFNNCCNSVYQELCRVSKLGASSDSVMPTIGLGPTGKYPRVSVELCLGGDDFVGQGQQGAVISKNIP